jgi:hypothetical protein
VHGVGQSPAQRIASPDAPAVSSGNGQRAADVGTVRPVVAPEVNAGSSRPHDPASLADSGKQPVSAIDAQLGEMMGDALFCDVCGHITVRSGACYRCLNSGNSLGCS